MRKNACTLLVLFLLLFLSTGALADITLTFNSSSSNCTYSAISATYTLHAVWTNGGCQASVDDVKGAALGYVCGTWVDKPALTHRQCKAGLCCCTNYEVPYSTVTVDNTCHTFTSPSIQKGFICE